MRANDILLAFPALLLAIVLAARYGGSITTAMIAIGVATIPGFVRVIRSGTLRVMSTDYVLAARVAGRSSFSIAVRHVLPNVSGLLIVQASSAYAIAILAEAGLSFLGLGAPQSVPSWGRMLYESQSLLTIAPLTALWPGLAIALAVLGFNLLGDGLRDRSTRPWCARDGTAAARPAAAGQRPDDQGRRRPAGARRRVRRSAAASGSA